MSRDPEPGVEALIADRTDPDDGLLEAALEVTGSRAELVWVEPDLLEREGVWLGAELGMRAPGVDFSRMRTDVSKVDTAGLTCRPIRETVASVRLCRPDEVRRRARPSLARRVLAALDAVRTGRGPTLCDNGVPA